MCMVPAFEDRTSQEDFLMRFTGPDGIFASLPSAWRQDSGVTLADLERTTLYLFRNSRSKPFCFRIACLLAHLEARIRRLFSEPDLQDRRCTTRVAVLASLKNLLAQLASAAAGFPTDFRPEQEYHSGKLQEVLQAMRRFGDAAVHFHWHRSALISMASVCIDDPEVESIKEKIHIKEKEQNFCSILSV